MTRVLIVDDDVRMCTALAGEVRRMGFEAIAADTIERANDVLTRSKVDVLVTDLRMAGRDGLDLIRMARISSPQTASVLMSAYATAADYKLAVQQGAVEVLTKPFQPEDLELAIKKALHSSQGLQGSIHGLELVDLIQMFHMGRRSLRIEVGDSGRIYMKDGEIIHAVHGAIKGIEALRGLLRLQKGNLQTLPPQACEVSITAPLEPLLLELAKEADEENRDFVPRRQELPMEDPVLPPPEPPSATAEEALVSETFGDPRKRWIATAAAAAVIGLIAAGLAVARYEPKEQVAVRPEPAQTKVVAPVEAPRSVEAPPPVVAPPISPARAEPREEEEAPRPDRKAKRVAKRVRNRKVEEPPVEPEPEPDPEPIVEAREPTIGVVDEGRPRIGVVDENAKPAVGVVDDGQPTKLAPLED